MARDQLIDKIRKTLTKKGEESEKQIISIDDTKSAKRTNPLNLMLADKLIKLLSQQEVRDRLVEYQTNQNLKALLFVDYYLNNANLEQANTIKKLLQKNADIDVIAEYASKSKFITHFIKNLNSKDVMARIENVEEPHKISELGNCLFIDYYLSTLKDVETKVEIIVMLKENKPLQHIAKFVAEKTATKKLTQTLGNEAINSRLKSDKNSLQAILFVDYFLSNVSKGNGEHKIIEMLEQGKPLKEIANYAATSSLFEKLSKNLIYEDVITKLENGESLKNLLAIDHYMNIIDEQGREEIKELLRKAKVSLEEVTKFTATTAAEYFKNQDKGKLGKFFSTSETKKLKEEILKKAGYKTNKK